MKLLALKGLASKQRLKYNHRAQAVVGCEQKNSGYIQTVVTPEALVFLADAVLI